LLVLILSECRLCGSDACGYFCRFFPGERSYREETPDLSAAMTKLKKEMEEILKGETDAAGRPQEF